MNQLRDAFLLLAVFTICIGCNKRVLLDGTGSGSTASNLSPGPVVQNYGQTQATPTPTPTPQSQRWVSTTSHVWATLDHSATINSTSATNIIWDNVIEDPLSEYNRTTGIFAPKANGIYSIRATITLPGPWTAGDYCKIFLSKSLLTIAVNMAVMPTHQKECSVSVSAVVPLAVGEGIIVSSTLAGSQRQTNVLANNPYVTLNIAKVAE